MTMMGGFGILGLLVPLLLLVFVVWAITSVFPDWQDRANPQRREDSAEETVRQRFARGEIDAEEYERSLEILRGGTTRRTYGEDSTRESGARGG
jgi:putative membrane protein